MNTFEEQRDLILSLLIHYCDIVSTRTKENWLHIPDSFMLFYKLKERFPQFFSYLTFEGWGFHLRSRHFDELISKCNGKHEWVVFYLSQSRFKNEISILEHSKLKAPYSYEEIKGVVDYLDEMVSSLEGYYFLKDIMTSIFSDRFLTTDVFEKLKNEKMIREDRHQGIKSKLEECGDLYIDAFHLARLNRGVYSEKHYDYAILINPWYSGFSGLFTSWVGFFSNKNSNNVFDEIIHITPRYLNISNPTIFRMKFKTTVEETDVLLDIYNSFFR